MSNERYKQFIMLLDPADNEEKAMIEFIEQKHTKKHKDSYSSILKAAVKALMAGKQD